MERRLLCFGHLDRRVPGQIVARPTSDQTCVHDDEVPPFAAVHIDVCRGPGATCEVTAAALAIALVLGFIIAVLKVVPCRPLPRALLDFYTSIFRGVPLIVLFMAYFATPQLTGYKISMFAAGVITLGLNGSATVSETVRGGNAGVDRGQYDAARAIGLPYGTMMRLIVIPQALRSVIPALVNEVITVLKSSSLVATIGLLDMMRAAQSVQALTYRAFEPFLAVAVVYYLIVMALTAAGHAVERKFCL